MQQEIDINAGTITVRSPLGCAARTFPGIRRRTEERHRPSSGFLDVLLSPWRAGPWAMRTPFWLPLQDELASRLSRSPSPGGILLVGEPHSIDQVLSSVKRTAGPFLVEFDMSRCTHDGSLEPLLGAPAGYIGFKEEGSPFTQALLTANQKATEWNEGHPCHRPMPVVVFKNLEKATLSAQEVAHKLATTATITLPGGSEFKLNAVFVVATCPSYQTATDTAESLRNAISAAVAPTTPRPLFHPDIVRDFFPVPFPLPTCVDFLSALSMQAGSQWAHMLPKGTLIHHRFFAGPRLTELVLKNARFSSSDISWARLADASALSAKSVLQNFTTAPLPSSFVTPDKMGVLVEVEDSRLWAEFRSFEEISKMEISLTLPFTVAEFLGLQVPASAYWSLPEAPEKLSSLVVGHKQITKDIASKIARTNRPPHHPVLSALLLGPTGTGKTHLAKALSSAYSRPLITINCATLQSEADLNEALFGYTSASLASRAASSPASVILLDEIEKAHPSVWHMLMSGLDEGLLKADGRPEINLSKSVILATTNLLSTELSTTIDQFRSKTVSENDAALRSVLSGFSSVDPAVLSRFTALYILPPPTGADEVLLWAHFLTSEFSIEATSDALVRIIKNHNELCLPANARAIRASIQNLLESPSALGLRLESGGLSVCSSSPDPLSLRQVKWLEASSNTHAFQAAATYPWAADLIQGVFQVNANKRAPRGPQGVFYLVGPSGSGKTHFPKELAVALGKGDAFVIDCSTVPSLTDSANFLLGESGKQRGVLTSALISRPDRIVVLDELDKAPPGFLNQFLGILDKGRVFDKFSGEEVSMLNAAFFLTSNYLPTEMQELCDLASLSQDSPSLPPIDACDSATAILVEKGLLSPEQAARIDLVVPYGLPSKAGFETYTNKIIEGVLEEYGLPNDMVPRVRVLLPSSVLEKLDSRSIRRHASKAASSLVEDVSRVGPVFA